MLAQHRDRSKGKSSRSRYGKAIPKIALGKCEETNTVRDGGRNLSQAQELTVEDINSE